MGPDACMGRRLLACRMLLAASPSAAHMSLLPPGHFCRPALNAWANSQAAASRTVQPAARQATCLRLPRRPALQKARSSFSFLSNKLLPCIPSPLPAVRQHATAFIFRFLRTLPSLSLPASPTGGRAARPPHSRTAMHFRPSFFRTHARAAITHHPPATATAQQLRREGGLRAWARLGGAAVSVCALGPCQCCPLLPRRADPPLVCALLRQARQATGAVARRKSNGGDGGWVVNKKQYFKLV